MPDVPAPVPEPETPAPKPVVSIQITLLSDGNVNLSGPLDKPGLMMKMIGGAMSAMAEYAERKEGQRLVTAAPMPPRLVMPNGRAR